MPVVHTADGRFFEVKEEELKKPVKLVCTGDGNHYEVDEEILTREVKEEHLPRHMQPGARAAAAREADAVGQPRQSHCAVCSVRG